MSGVSGAGREPRPDLLFSEVNESARAYGMFNHRHIAEIEQELEQQGERGAPAGRDANPGAAPVDFLPHLVPMTRAFRQLPRQAHAHGYPGGARRSLRRSLSGRAVRSGRGRPALDQACYGSNFCRIWIKVDPRGGRILALGVIDNLVKGAAGQAVEVFNVLFGLPETTGLEQLPIAP